MRRQSKAKKTGSQGSGKRKPQGLLWSSSEYPHVAKAHAYINGVLVGSIDVCKFVKLACKRHLDDLKKSKRASFPYFFDPAAGEEICEFTEMFPHVKGPLTNTLIVLEPWQCFVNVVLFGWKCKAPHPQKKGFYARRFQESYEELPRKNGKSINGATRGLYMLTLDEEPGAESYCGATTQKQANEVFQPARLMAKHTPDFLDEFDIVVGAESIFIRDSASKFERLIGNPGDGGNPHFALIDEYHQHKTDDQKETMATGMGARLQPLLSEITTAGRNISYPCYHRRKYAEAVLEGRIKDDRFFCIIYTIDPEDDWKDFKSWIKANPNYGVSVTEDYLKKQYHAALNQPSKQAINCCKHLNMWVGASAGWLNMAKWSKSKTDYELIDFKEQQCWVAFDLASKIDLASVTILFDFDGKKYAFTKNYMPRETVDRRENEHYRNYEKMGLLTVTEGARTDFDIIEQDLKELNELFDIQAIGYDPKEATMLVNNILKWFYNPVVEIIQSSANMNEPMEELEAMVEAGELVTEKNLLFDWCASNVVQKQSANKYYYPAKENVANKIDPIVALIMCIKLMMGEEEFSPSATAV